MNILEKTMYSIRQELGLAPCKFDGTGVPYMTKATVKWCQKDLDNKKNNKVKRNRKEV